MAAPARSACALRGNSPSSAIWPKKIDCRNFAADETMRGYGRAWGGGEGAGLGSGALRSSVLRTDVVAAFRLLDLDRDPRLEAESLGNIVVPAINVAAELDARAVPERRLVEQSDWDWCLELDELFVVLAHRLLELVE